MTSSYFSYVQRDRKKSKKYFAIFAIQLQFYKNLLHAFKSAHVEFLLVQYTFDLFPLYLTYKTKMQLRVIHTFLDVPLLIQRTFTVISLLGSSLKSIGVEYIFNLRCSQIKKSRSIRPALLCRQASRSPLPIQLIGCLLLKSLLLGLYDGMSTVLLNIKVLLQMSKVLTSTTSCHVQEALTSNIYIF